MNAVLAEEYIDAQEAGHEEYEYMTHEEVVEGTRYIIEKHKEALKALANA